ncbi:MAG: YlmC/YmxH family sporulation protein [Clostridia bacterium]|nr:YlmC/YmxH family sporulation protein [Clostridia bacterium]
MILSYKELKKRDVVNIADGRSFGKLTDLKLDFPCGVLKGIVVCDRKRGGFLGLWCKNEIFIDEKHIIRIGGDVILVNLKNSDTVMPSVVDINAKNGKNAAFPPQKKPSPCPPKPPCPPCGKPVPPSPPKPPCPPPPQIAPCDFTENAEEYEEDVRIDFEDY